MGDLLRRAALVAHRFENSIDMLLPGVPDAADQARHINFCVKVDAAIWGTMPDKLAVRRQGGSSQPDFRTRQRQL